MAFLETSKWTRLALARDGDTGHHVRLLMFVSEALAVSWVLLSNPLPVGIPVVPFVLATMCLGLVLLTVPLPPRDPGRSARALLRDRLRLAGPLWVLQPGARVIHAGIAAVGAATGVSGTGAAPGRTSEGPIGTAAGGGQR